MSVMNKVTRNTLFRNKTRTIVTIIGIILSAAMFTAVTTFIASLQDYFTRSVAAQTGNWHVECAPLTPEHAAEIAADAGVDACASVASLGYAELPESENEYKPYLNVEAYSAEAFGMIPLTLTAGRLPENGSELLVSDHIRDNGNVVYNVGDTLTLTLGQRVSESGDVLDQSSGYRDGEAGDEFYETFEPGETRAFTVVGTCERPTLEGYSSPGFSVFTLADGTDPAESSALRAYVRLRNPAGVYDWIARQADGTTYFTPNDDLLRSMGISGMNAFNTILYSLTIILSLLILLGSVSLVYNAFSISVSERSRQFGLLASVGATRRQMRASVFYEALVVGVPGIVLGVLSGVAGIGVTLFCLRDVFKGMFGDAVPMRLTVTPWSIVAAVLITGVTVLISAWIPARRASRITPIEAIRQTGDVKLTRRQVKTSRLTLAAFGLPGALARKNFKRGRRRYRATVVSLILSIVLFVSAGAFGMYMTAGVGSVYSQPTYEVAYSGGSGFDDTDALYAKLTALPEVDAVVRFGSLFTGTVVDRNLLSDRVLGYYDSGEEPEPTLNVYPTLAVLEDDVFADYAASVGLNAADFAPADAQPVICCDTLHFYDPSAQRMADLSFFRDHSQKTLRLTPSSIPDAAEVEVTLAAFTDRLPLGVDSLAGGGAILVLPRSSAEALLGDMPYSSFDFAVKAPDAGKAFSAVRQVLLDNGMSVGSLDNRMELTENNRNLMTVMTVFSTGFITLISLIAVTNVFNTISTNVFLRRREIAQLRSVGMNRSGMRAMMNYECVFYGLKALVWGLPLAVGVTYLIYRSLLSGIDLPFFLPWADIGIAVGSVFAVVFVTMLYAMRKVSRGSITDALRAENL